MPSATQCSYMAACPCSCGRTVSTWSATTVLACNNPTVGGRQSHAIIPHMPNPHTGEPPVHQHRVTRHTSAVVRSGRVHVTARRSEQKLWAHALREGHREGRNTAGLVDGWCRLDGSGCSAARYAGHSSSSRERDTMCIHQGSGARLSRSEFTTAYGRLAFELAP